MAISSCLVDTNILLRLTRRSDPQHDIIRAALVKLASDRCQLHFAHQNIAELWNVMTRPVARNGLGLSSSDADREVQAIETGMSLLPDNGAVYRAWRRIVVQCGVSGVQVHDARLAAVMEVNGVGHILTLNTADFNRFSGITAVHPSMVPAL